jgi:hypothetical protein
MMNRRWTRFAPWVFVLAVAPLSATAGEETTAARVRAAMTRAKANDAEAIPVLIDLLGQLPPAQLRPIEELLTQLAGEWTPTMNVQGEDDIARNIRRDVWAAWWRNTNGKALLAAIHKHVLSATDRATIRDLLGKLADKEVASREEAGQKLFAFGRRGLPQLHEAVKNANPEVSRRVQELIERIERDSTNDLPLAAIRLLGLRKPDGAVEALLAYFPFAEEEARLAEVRKSLGTLALREGKPDPALVAALADSQPFVRSIAAEALIQGGGAPGRAATRKLIKDTVPAVRLRVALALAIAKEREAVPVLIDLLAVLPDDDVGSVEDALQQLAGDSAPKVSLGTNKDERKKCRAAWADWWKTNEKRVDLARLTVRSWYGHTLLCDFGANRVLEVDRHGKERWAITNLQGPMDAVVVAGNRVLIAEFHGNRVTERDFKGKIVWEKQGLQGRPINVQRLRNGNTFIATNVQVLEVDRAGKEVYSFNVRVIMGAYRTRDGNIVCLDRFNQCTLMDKTGKKLKSFAVNTRRVNYGGLDVLPNGHVLIGEMQRGKVAEYDGDGKSVREWDVQLAQSVSGLPNGHVLVSSQNRGGVVELDRAGKVVWEYKSPSQIFRARRR